MNSSLCLTACLYRVRSSHTCNNNKSEDSLQAALTLTAAAIILITPLNKHISPRSQQTFRNVTSFTHFCCESCRSQLLLFGLVSCDRVYLLVLVNHLKNYQLAVPPLSPAWRHARHTVVVKSMPGSYLSHDIDSTHLRQQ